MRRHLCISVVCYDCTDDQDRGEMDFVDTKAYVNVSEEEEEEEEDAMVTARNQMVQLKLQVLLVCTVLGTTQVVGRKRERKRDKE